MRSDVDVFPEMTEVICFSLDALEEPCKTDVLSIYDDFNEPLVGVVKLWLTPEGADGP